MPSFDITAFTLSEFRQMNAASATLEQVVRVMKAWALFCDKERLDLDNRMREGRFLDMGEIDGLVEWCGRTLPDMEAIVEAELEVRPSARTNVRSLESHRRRAGKPSQLVDRDTAAMRIRYIANFLGWKADRYLLVLSANHPNQIGRAHV